MFHSVGVLDEKCSESFPGHPGKSSPGLAAGGDEDEVLMFWLEVSSLPYWAIFSITRLLQRQLHWNVGPSGGIEIAIAVAYA